jgi:ankyrin repeat protein
MSQEVSNMVREYIGSLLQNFEDFKVKVLQYLQNGGDINAIGTSNEHPLVVACGYADFQCIKFLVEHGANVNYVDAWGYTPLNNTIMSNKVEELKYLVRNGANINYLDQRKHYPIDYATTYNIEIAKYLYSLGGKANRDVSFLAENV